MLLTELFPLSLLESMIDQRYVSAQWIYPDNHLVIYRYTRKVVDESVWNSVTLQCQGLIVNVRTKEVVARPYPKFYHHGGDELVRATDRLDSFLGIYYHETCHGPCIATQGSFTSVEATIATAMIQHRYHDWVPADEHYTPLFEISLTAGNLHLTLLGAVHKDSGVAIGPADAAECLGWEWAKVESFPDSDPDPQEVLT